MKRLVYLILLTNFLGSCNQKGNKSLTSNEITTTKDSLKVAIDTIARITGVGGIFFISENPKQTKDWYAKNLGLQVNPWGSSFEFRNANDSDEINYMQWSPMSKASEYFNPSEKEFMINYRVHNLEGLLKQLKANKVNIIDSITTYDYGKFVHIMDAEGRKIELWEPVDSVLTAMGGKTTK